MASNRVVIRTDNSQKYKTRIKQMRGARAGYLSETTGGQMPYGNDLTLATNAFYQEYGTTSKLGNKHIPARPFMALAAEMMRRSPKKVELLLKGYMRGAYDAKNLNDKLGALQAVEIQRSIRAGAWTPNAPATVAAKQSSQPLQDDGHLLQGVDFAGKK